jgi:hypothetical protein
MTGSKVVLTGLSAAMDGGFTAIADVSTAMVSAGAAGDYRLIGGVTVMLHIERLGLDLPLRATGDADFGVPPHVLRRPDLVQAIEALGYKKVFGRSSTTSTGVPIVRSSTTTFTTSSSPRSQSRPRCRPGTSGTASRRTPHVACEPSSLEHALVFSQMVRRAGCGGRWA